MMQTPVHKRGASLYEENPQIKDLARESARIYESDKKLEVRMGDGRVIGAY